MLIRFRDGSRMNLEMQMMAYGYWKERVLFYLCRIYTGQLKKGESYDKLKKCVHVSVLGFNQFPEDETCFRVFHMKEEGATDALLRQAGNHGTGAEKTASGGPERGGGGPLDAFPQWERGRRI